MPRKYIYKEVKKIFEDKGCELLDIEYKGVQVPLNYRCKCGNITKASLYGFRKSNGCYKCSEWNQSRKYTYENVKKTFADRNCELLEDHYENNRQVLNYRCKCGAVSKTRFDDFLRGRYCIKCRSKTVSQMFRASDEDITKFCEEYGCQFIESWIYKKKTRIKYICKCGNETEAYFTNFKRYPNCKKCGNKKVSGDNCYMWNPNREEVKLNKKYRKTCGRLLKRGMDATGGKKTDHTFVMLGYTSKQLQDHINNHPNYKGEDDLRIDHIFPIKAFLDYGVTNLKLINRLDNLQPLTEQENLTKADKYDKREFEDWLDVNL